MSEYFKAAARCDITVVRISPLFINEKDIIEEELKARQYDTLTQRAEHEEHLKNKLNSASMDNLRREEEQERVQKLRRELKRQEAIEKKERERQAKEILERQRQEELELKRMAVVEEKRAALAAERQAASVKSQQKQLEASQRRLKRAVPKSVEEQAEELPEDPSTLSYMERMRMEKERLGRMEQIHGGNPSVKALYSIELPKLQSPTQLQRDITSRRQQEAARLKAEQDALLREEQEEEECGQQQRLRTMLARKMSHEEWLRRHRAAERAEQAVREAEAQLEAAQRLAEHPIDIMHRQVEALLLAEREAQEVMDDNLRAGYSHLDRLEEQLDLEKDAWREQRQMEHEMARSMISS
eukprot:GGOE01065373.1.p1 GENE.GGOE01065373.1~~GGOE01065373.1.p1  ORF type:complete len:382 (+),score=148.30 GGOE01065373.1:81-1148(+)